MSATTDDTTPPGRSRAIGLALRLSAFAVAIGVVAIFATQWSSWVGDSRHQTTDDAYLQADLTPISARVAGYVRAVPVEDFQRVHAGDVLALIVDDDYNALVAQAEASVAAASAQVETLESQASLQDETIAAADAVVAATGATLAEAIRERTRQHTLTQAGSASVELQERADTTVAQLTAQLDQNRAQAEGARRQLKVLSAQAGQARAALAAQTAALQTASINLAYTRIRAPQDGEIGQRAVRPGQYLGVGGQVTTLTPLPNVWVIANYKETQLTHMEVGQPAAITVDTFPGHTLTGHVIAYAPGSGSQFALLPPDNATGNFTKVVQRIAVKIVIDDADGLADRLRPGMSVIADIDTRPPSKAP